MESASAADKAFLFEKKPLKIDINEPNTSTNG
jgi:hypothetical protein